VILDVQAKLRNGGYDAEEIIKASCSENTMNTDIAELRAMSATEKKG
jgi:hypothetical protein